uniref:Protein Spindly n=1 Tax=Leptobrachium leishanense TaxID=445787 RepID=A0A8C5QLH2_9ANUR
MGDSEVFLKLRRQLKEAEEERIKAAQYGLELLESQSDLQNQLEEQRSEMTTTIENLEQDKFSLQREVELKNRMLESVTSECDNIKQQLKISLEQLQVQLERTHNREVSDLKDKLEKLKAELDEARLSEKQLKHKLDYQSEVLANKSEELRLMSERVHETMSSEMLTLQLEKTELESAKDILEEEINELQYRQQQLVLTNTNQSRQVERLQEEKDEREKEAVAYFSALEKARETNQELQCQLDQALQQAQDPNSKGNSLFSEVEDRRAEMERQLIGVKVQYQSLQKQHAFSRQQMHRMKQNSENEQTGKNSNPGQEDETYYVDLLKMKLDNSSKEIEKIKDELSLQRMKALAESQRVLELERKLFTNERQLKLSQTENMKLRVNLDEIKMKYEPDEMVNFRIQKRRREQLPLDCPSENPADHNIMARNAADLPPETLKESEECSTGHTEDHSSKTSNPAPAEEPVGPVSTQQSKAAKGHSVKERKRVRIVEDENKVHTLNKSGTNDCSNPATSPRSKTEDASIETKKPEERETRKNERKSRLKAQPVLYVSSKPASVTQCPQQ